MVIPFYSFNLDFWAWKPCNIDLGNRTGDVGKGAASVLDFTARPSPLLGKVSPDANHRFSFVGHNKASVLI